MRKAGRVVVLFLLSLLSTAVLGAMTALMAAVSLAATALIVPGTGTPNANGVTSYLENFRDYYMQGTPCTDDVNCPKWDPLSPEDGGLLGVNYPASFWPIPLPGWCPNLSCDTFNVSVDTGVENLKGALEDLQDLGYTGDVVIAGYSQGARVVSIAKTNIANDPEWAALIDQLESVEFVFIGNPNRPNGGLLSRLGILGTIPILDVTTGQPTPTGPAPGFKTSDWAIRWEGIADFPQYLLNPLAVANSLLGFYYDHGTYLAINGGSDPGELPAGYDPDLWLDIVQNPQNYPGIVDIQEYGDTTYYTVTPKVLPLVRPLHSIPFIGKPIADLIEPALRVIIEETGYNRNIPFGQPTEIGLFPIFNPFTLVLKLIPAIFQGINNFLANFGLATEIPLSPTTPIPVPEEDEEQDENLEQFSLLSNFDDMSGAKSGLSLVQDTGGVEQQLEGDEKTVALGLDNEEKVTLPEIVETPNPEDTAGLEGAGLQQDPEGNVDGLLEEGNNPDQGDPNQGDPNQLDPNEGTQIVVKDPEENQDLDDNRVDANGGSVSLNFSPNKPEGAPAGGENADPLDPVDPVDTVDPDVEGAEGAEGAEGTEQAAA